MPNDDFDHRLLLTLGVEVASATTGCTVQWACVDERLTGKCIDYHNDQWFAFRPPRPGRYYANLGGQRCRDIRGVQLVVLTAARPCDPSTYQIWSCSSLGTQDDIFVPIDAPQAGQEILLNVDGYRHDFCTFRLLLDTVARGVPVQPLAVGWSKETTSAVVPLTWLLPDSLASGTTVFRIRRRATVAARATEVTQMPVNRNAAGRTDLAYAYTDTLPAPGTYTYQIVAISAPEPIVLQQFVLTWRPTGAFPTNAYVNLPLDKFSVGDELSVTISDALTGRLLRHTQLVKRKPRQAPFQGRLLTAPYLQAGIRRLRITVTAAPAADGSSRSRTVELPLPGAVLPLHP